MMVNTVLELVPHDEGSSKLVCCCAHPKSKACSPPGLARVSKDGTIAKAQPAKISPAYLSSVSPWY